MHWVHQQELTTLRVLMMQGLVARFGAQEAGSSQVWQEWLCFPNAALAHRKPVAFCAL